MTTLTERTTSERVKAESTHQPGDAESIIGEVRAEFLEMPGLSLTAAQAARLFGVDVPRSRQLLQRLLDEGLLVCDRRGAFRRRDVSMGAGRTTDGWTRVPGSDASNGRHPSRGSMQRPDDVLEAMSVELPCLGCHREYRVSLRQIRQSQLMMAAGCPVRHFADCPPAAFSHLIDPSVLAGFEEAVDRIETATEGAGGRLVGPR